MRERSPKIFFEDIQDSIEKIERYTKDLTYETFSKKDMVIDAVIRNLEIIGTLIPIFLPFRYKL